MKKRNLVKFLTITLSLTIAFTTVAMAKERTTIEYNKISTCAIVSHPTEVEVPD